MTKFFCIPAVLWALAALPASAAPDAGPPAPFELVRSLQALEDQIAQGSTIAQAAQPKLIAHIAERFRAADDAVWQTPKNARAAVTYLFSGGQPGAVRAILARGTFPKEYDKLVKGALAYAEGQDAVARDLLEDIDARSLPVNLGAHLALVQAMLVPVEDRARAMRLLDLARLLAPGTLVEEAALRREIFVVGDGGATDRFIALSRQYVRRFQHSVYADNFRQRFASTVTKLAVSGDVQQFHMVETLLDELKVDDQRKLYLAMAQAALLQGKTAVAGLAAEKASKLSQDGSGDGARSNLYLAAAMIVTDKYDKGVLTLKGIDRSRLSQRDAELRDAALMMAKTLRKTADAADSEASAPARPPSAPMAEAGGPAGEEKSSTVIDLAEKAITDADLLLKEPSP